MSGQPDGRIARLVFEGLVSSDPKTLAPFRPRRALGSLPDGLVYTFHLGRASSGPTAIR
jgi:ABC-type oligopeptide transport system substrate-binding subunit